MGRLHTVRRLEDPVRGLVVQKRVADASREDLRLRLVHEARALSRCAGRPTPRLLAFHPDGSLVMEHVAGAEPVRWLGHGRARARDAWQLVTAVADAVGRLHDHGIVHRDLKPAHVRVEAGGAVRLLDLGVCAPLGAAHALGPAWEDLAAGTVAYAPPELRGCPDRATAATVDVYALGVLALEIATGERLPEVDGGAAWRGEWVRWRFVEQGFPAACAAVVQAATADDPRSRPATAAAWRRLWWEAGRARFRA
ncbi:MAG: protein kinase [Gemmatimonadota bacterium]